MSGRINVEAVRRGIGVVGVLGTGMHQHHNAVCEEDMRFLCLSIMFGADLSAIV